MKFYSTRNAALRHSFADAVIEGLAPDGGLFLPERITPFSAEELARIRDASFNEIAFQVAHQLLQDAIPAAELRKIIERSYDFEVKLAPLAPSVSVLELFHGPTLAFKDFGARFLAQTLAWLAREQKEEITVLVATSGDTGSAVAAGFFGTPGVRVALLYPKGRVSPLQEKQLTTFGGNIHAFEVEGSFDDCQALVKQAFQDSNLRRSLKITSANSINIARLIPQTFYYFSAWSQLDAPAEISFAVPSGNFGNITAAVMARMLGLPVKNLVAGTNRNDTIPRYLRTGKYIPMESVATISNAMDVGNPSNVERLNALHGSAIESLRLGISAVNFTDQETRELMVELYSRFSYLAEPHTAIAYGALRQLPAPAPDSPQVLLATAHPIKFSEVVEETLGITPPLPESLEAIMQKPKLARALRPSYADFQRELLALPW